MKAAAGKFADKIFATAAFWWFGVEGCHSCRFLAFEVLHSELYAVPVKADKIHRQVTGVIFSFIWDSAHVWRDRTLLLLTQGKHRLGFDMAMGPTTQIVSLRAHFVRSFGFDMVIGLTKSAHIFDHAKCESKSPWPYQMFIPYTGGFCT